MANEKRLIYLEDAKEALIGWETDPTDGEIEYTLDNLPTVDAVEVVRCKDCKHWKLIDGLNPHWECQIFYGLHEYGYLTGADDFCSYGERRKERGRMTTNFYKNGKLKDKEIVSALRQVADQYENGELIEVRDLLQDIVDAIDEFESDQEW